MVSETTEPQIDAIERSDVETAKKEYIAWWNESQQEGGAQRYEQSLGGDLGTVVYERPEDPDAGHLYVTTRDLEEADKAARADPDGILSSVAELRPGVFAPSDIVGNRALLSWLVDMGVLLPADIEPKHIDDDDLEESPWGSTVGETPMRPSGRAQHAGARIVDLVRRAAGLKPRE